MSEKLKKEVWGHFKQTQKVYLATFGENYPRVRPVTLIFYDKNFYIATGMEDAKVKQIKKYPNVEFCLTIKDDKNEGYIRSLGIAKLEKNIEIKQKIMDIIPYIKEFWTQADDPKYALLKIDLKEIEYLKIGEWLAKKLKL